ncbi:S-layer homology domain-containing protein [Tissierellaceae bacterium HCP3S3_D8]
MSDFNDIASVNDYARNATAELVKSGVITGNHEKLDPQGPSTRAQMTQILYNLLSK